MGLIVALFALCGSGNPVGVRQEHQAPGLTAPRITTIALSADGRLAATGDAAGPVQIWDARTRRLQRTLRAHTAAVSSLAFSADRTLLASGSFDQSIRLWHVGSNRPAQTLAGHPSQVKGLAFSADGKLLVSSGADGARVWDITSASLRTALPTPGGTVGVAFSPDGAVVASGGSDGLRLWDVTTGSLLRHLAGEGNQLILAIAFSRGGRWIAAGGTDGAARLWDASSGELKRTSDQGADFVRALVFVNDNSRVLVANRTALRSWSIPSGEMQPLRAWTDLVVVALSAGGRAFAGARHSGTIETFHIPEP